MRKKIRIGSFEISNSSKPFIIAELSANHGGSIDLALESVRAAKRSGADCIKLQTYTNIWNLLKFQLIESIREIMFIDEGTGPVESHKVQVIKIYNTMQDFKTYINKQFSHYGKIFKNNSPSITLNWEPKDV